MYKTYTGSGTQPLVWDGLFNSKPVPQGKYNIVLKNAKQPGKERVREVAKVGVDMSPPEISYQINKTRVGRTTGELKVVVTDPQSGVDHSKARAENINSNTQAGVPMVQGEPAIEIQSENKLVLRYDLLIPTFT